MEAIDLRHGIWRGDDISIGLLTDKVLIVGVQSGTMADIDRATHYLKQTFPDYQIIALRGPLEFEALSASSDLRKLIKEIVEESH